MAKSDLMQNAFCDCTMYFYSRYLLNETSVNLATVIDTSHSTGA